MVPGADRHSGRNIPGRRGGARTPGRVACGGGVRCRVAGRRVRRFVRRPRRQRRARGRGQGGRAVGHPHPTDRAAVGVGTAGRAALRGFSFSDEEARPVAVVNRGRRGYELFDPVSGDTAPVNRRRAESLRPEGVMLYPPLARSVKSGLAAVLQGFARSGSGHLRCGPHGRAPRRPDRLADPGPHRRAAGRDHPEGWTSRCGSAALAALGVGALGHRRRLDRRARSACCESRPGSMKTLQAAGMEPAAFAAAAILQALSRRRSGGPGERREPRPPVC